MACQFEQMMEFGDAFDEEAPSPIPQEERTNEKCMVADDLHAGGNGHR